MSRRYSIAEARSSLSAIIGNVESGQEVELTRRGKPVAVVVSLREYERLRNDRPTFECAYQRFLEKYSLEEVGLEDDFFTSIRDRDQGRKVCL